MTDPMRMKRAMRLAPIVVLAVACGPSVIDSIDEVKVAEVYASLMCECECSSSEAQTGCSVEVQRYLAIWQENARLDGLTYDEDCLQGIRAATDGGRCERPPFCQIFFGDGQLGQPCRLYGNSDKMSSCAQGLLCNIDFGFCTDPNVPIDRDNFLGEGTQCVDESGQGLGICDWHQGLFCDVDGPIPLCAATAQDGEACTADNGCGLGTFCDGGACAPLKGSGATCERYEECQGRTCDDGHCIDRLAVPNDCSTPNL